MANLLPLHMHNMHLPRCSNFRTFPLTAKAASSNGVPFNNNNNINISGTSKSGGGRGPVILEIPIDKIRRPLMRTRSNDPEKVKDLMDSIQQIGLQVPLFSTSCRSMCLKSMEFIMVSQAATDMRLTSDLDSQQSVVKCDVEQKKP